MIVYQFQTSDDACTLMPVREPEGDAFERLNGQAIDPNSWPKVTVRVVRDGSGGTEATDFGLVWTEPAVNFHTVEALSDLLRQNGQILPLLSEDGDYCAYNVTTLLDALDEDRSVVERFSSGRVMSVQRFVFRPEVIAAHPIFKIPQFPHAHAFITDEFVRRVQSARLTGLAPKTLWDGPDSSAA
jgi:hypothetical protein